MPFWKNTASQKWRVFAYLRTDGSAKTGDAAQITAKISKDWGAAVAVTDTNPTEIEDGYYDFDLSQAETNADALHLLPESSTANINVIPCPAAIFPLPKASTVGLPSVSADAISDDATAANNLELATENAVAGYVAADMTHIHGSALTETAGQLAGRFVDFFDQAAAGYSVATALADFKATGFSTAAVVGTLADAAAAGDPTEADTLMQYAKQLINVLVGTTGVTTFPAGVAPANGVSLAEALRATYNFSVSSAAWGSINSGIVFRGTVTAADPGVSFTIGGLAGQGAGAFIDANTPWYAYVFRDGGGAAAAPQGETQQITGYTSATGLFTTNAFTVAVAVGDDVVIMSGRIAAVPDILADTVNIQAQIGTAGAGLTDLGGMSTGMKAEIEAECNDALVAVNLDHLLKVALADDGDIVNDSAIAQIMASDGDFTGYDKSTDSLEAIKDTAAGDASAANQTTIITHLTDLKGTGFAKDTDSMINVAHIGADSDTLETLSDQLDAIAGGGSTYNITVEDRDITVE